MNKNGSKSDVSVVYNGINQWSFETPKIAVNKENDHVVLFQLPITQNELRPHRSPDVWDPNHVRMPCSDQSKYTEIDENGTKITKKRWDLIEQSLLIDYDSSFALEKAIKSYNTRYESWNFSSLHNFVNNVLSANERDRFLSDILPKIVRLALRLPEIIQAPIPLLKRGSSKSISMTQQQAACILANAFFCTFPRRNTTKRDAEFANYPEINFTRLYASDSHRSAQKLYCIINYFDRVLASEEPGGVITFSRRSLSFDQLPDWSNNVKTLSSVKFYVSCDEGIESASGMLQVDFANKYIGGGVLGNGLVQEEIRFLINPELIVAKLFAECLDHEESFAVIGTEQFNAYCGYASTFMFKGNFYDTTPRDEYRRRRCHIVAIDALPYRSNMEQFHEKNLLRELNKAYAGFYNESQSPQPVSSGFWGAGAFLGNPIKAALIQFMVCREVRRNLAFFTFGDKSFQQVIFDLFVIIQERNVTIGQLFKILKQFSSSSAGDLATFVREKTAKTTVIAPRAQQRPQSKISAPLFSSQDSIANISQACVKKTETLMSSSNQSITFKSVPSESSSNHPPTHAKPRENENPKRSLLDRLDDDFLK